MINILVLGDSHCDVFNYCNQKQSKIHFEVVVVGGATAQGAVNPNSATNALILFKNKLKTTNPNEFHYIMIHLGEVDCGFVIWYRKEKYNIRIEDQLKISTDNLFQFIHSEIVPYFEPSKIIVNGSVLPTIQDNTDKNYLMGARSQVNASIQDRTQLTLQYNDQLKHFSFQYGYNYMDITADILDNVSNTVNTHYLNKNIYDHHLNNETTYSFWLRELHQIIDVEVD